MVMGDDLCSRDSGFHYQHRILDSLSKLYSLFEKTENKHKRGRVVGKTNFGVSCNYFNKCDVALFTFTVVRQTPSV